LESDVWQWEGGSRKKRSGHEKSRGEVEGRVAVSSRKRGQCGMKNDKNDVVQF